MGGCNFEYKAQGLDYTDNTGLDGDKSRMSYVSNL